MALSWKTGFLDLFLGKMGLFSDVSTVRVCE